MRKTNEDTQPETEAMAAQGLAGVCAAELGTFEGCCGVSTHVLVFRTEGMALNQEPALAGCWPIAEAKRYVPSPEGLSANTDLVPRSCRSSHRHPVAW